MGFYLITRRENTLAIDHSMGYLAHIMDEITGQADEARRSWSAMIGDVRGCHVILKQS